MHTLGRSFDKEPYGIWVPEAISGATVCHESQGSVQDYKKMYSGLMPPGGGTQLGTQSTKSDGLLNVHQGRIPPKKMRNHEL